MGVGKAAASSWNVLDLVVVVMGFVNIFAPSNLTGIRTIRALRPLRAVNKVKGMKVLVTTMLGSLPMLLDVFVLCAFAYFMFGIVAVQLFAGVLQLRCGAPDVSSAHITTGADGSSLLLNVTYTVPEEEAGDMCSGPLSSEVTWLVVNGTPVAQAGRTYGGRACDDGLFCTQYGNPADGLVSYDNILWAWLTIFQHITMSSWSDVMYEIGDAVSFWTWIFYIAIIIFGAFFMVNLALAVLSIHFAADNLQAARERQSKEDARSAAVAGTLSPDPTDVSFEAMGRVVPRKERDGDGPPLELSAFRRAAWRVAVSKGLEYTTATLIVLNTIVMCVNWHLMPTRVEAVTNYINVALTIYFLVELLVKLTAFGFKRYFDDGMNIFDALVVAVSVTELVLAAIPSVSGVGPLSVLRAFRLLRVFRLARHWRELDVIIRGMLKSVTASIMLVLLMLLFLLIASLVGMQLFGYQLTIALSCVCLVLDAPSLDPASTLARVLHYLDWVFVAAFSVEALLKIATFGFAFTGPRAYIRDGWNALDFAIVLVGYALIIVESLGVDAANLKMLRVLRALRVSRGWGALRPLRAANRFAGLRVVVNTLFAVLPSMLNVALVCMLFYVIFAILSVNLFKGELYGCVDRGSGERLDPDYVLPPGEVLTRGWCEAGTRPINASAYHTSRNISMPAYDITVEWVNPIANFDNPGVAAFTLFQVATLSGWVDVAFSAVDSTHVDQQPVWNHNPLVILFFVFFIIVCAFCVLNLFIGVTLEKFHELQAESRSAGILLTPQQRTWVGMQKLLLRVGVQRRPPVPRSRLRRLLHRVATSKGFEWLVVVVIVANVVFMAMVHTDMSSMWQGIMSFSNLVFTSLFVLEAALKIAAWGGFYFRDAWNCFDFFVVLASVTSVALDFSNTRNLSFMPALRVLRIVRVFRLIRSAEGMRKLMATLVTSLPALANVGGVMLLFFFIYAIIGVNLFAGIKYGENLDRHANFDSFVSAMLLLFRMLTGEGWDGVMQDCMVTRGCVLVTADALSPATNTTLPAGSYLDPHDPLLSGVPAAALDNQCPISAAAAVIYFPTFVVLCTLILLQLVIAVLLDNLTEADADHGLPVSKAALDSFVAVWGLLDGEGRGLLHASQLPQLLLLTEPPLGTKGLPGYREATQAMVFRVDVPMYGNNTVSFTEVLHALAGRVCGAELPDVAEEEVYARLAARLPRGARHGAYTAAHFHAADAVRAAIRGFLLRRGLCAELGGPISKRQLVKMEGNRIASLSSVILRTAASDSGPPGQGRRHEGGGGGARGGFAAGGGFGGQGREHEDDGFDEDGGFGTGGGYEASGGFGAVAGMRVHSNMLFNGRRLGDVRGELSAGGARHAGVVLPALRFGAVGVAPEGIVPPSLQHRTNAVAASSGGSGIGRGGRGAAVLPPRASGTAAGSGAGPQPGLAAAEARVPAGPAGAPPVARVPLPAALAHGGPPPAQLLPQSAEGGPGVGAQLLSWQGGAAGMPRSPTDSAPPRPPSASAAQQRAHPDGADPAAGVEWERPLSPTDDPPPTVVHVAPVQEAQPSQPPVRYMRVPRE
ncbi:Sodium channel protein type 5 subunit alpha [Tetrabaena socialis]|uniref:Sodium channel protein type 5 subunit alpha n=2 Tax=Tetrabaena socialis TaxID=47790 RepID=A0A2J8ABL3_9CHLO|nr:Sodium channel protein type 5 subunit alpha [Tetrabaena socialis]|eukprot:PNH09896.1 Sodium channel protein type 5 subunit alpha [Tetrabaena socialis]